MSRFLSLKFRFYTFTCIALLVFVHGYNLNETYLQPFTTVNEPLTVTTFLEYFIANGILRFRIPLLFLISGYIHATKDNRPYGQQLGRRVRTLLVPYLIWSAVGLLITYLWQQHPVTARAVFESRIDQAGDNRPYSEIGWGGVLFRWLFAPIAFQVWFILALFLYDAFYPLIRRVVMRYPIPWFAITMVLWASELSFFVVEGRGLLFFSVGIWLQKMDVNLEKKPGWLSMYICWVLFIGFSVIKTFMAFELEPKSALTYWVLILLHNISVLAGIAAVWFGADRLVRWCTRKQWFMRISSYSFFVFGLHVPLVIYLGRLAFIYLDHIPGYRLMVYLAVPTLVLLFCIGMAMLVRAVMPRIYAVATGGRGIGGTL